MAAGNYTVVVKDANACSIQLFITDATLADVEIITINEIDCYPNPFLEELTIELHFLNGLRLTVEVFNQSGQKIRTIIEDKNIFNNSEQSLPNKLTRCSDEKDFTSDQLK